MSRQFSLTKLHVGSHTAATGLSTHAAPVGLGGDQALLEGLQHEPQGRKEIAFAESAKAVKCFTIINVYHNY